MVVAHRLGRSACPMGLLADHPDLSLLLVHPDLCSGVGGYSFRNHGVDLGDERGVLIEGVFDLGIPFASFEFVKVYGECDDFVICVNRGGGVGGVGDLVV